MARQLACPRVTAPPMEIHDRPLPLEPVIARFAAVVDLASESGVTQLLEYWGIAQTLSTTGEALLVDGSEPAPAVQQIDVLTAHGSDAMVATMRTTVTLDADVEQRLREAMRLQGKSFKRALNDALRRGLGSSHGTQEDVPFEIQSRSLQLRAGLDPAALRDLDDDLEAAEFIRKTARLKEARQ